MDMQQPEPPETPEAVEIRRLMRQLDTNAENRKALTSLLYEAMTVIGTLRRALDDKTKVSTTITDGFFERAKAIGFVPLK